MRVCVSVTLNNIYKMLKKIFIKWVIFFYLRPVIKREKLYVVFEVI